TAPDFIAICQAMLAERGLPAVPDKLIRDEVSGGAKAKVAATIALAPPETSSRISLSGTAGKPRSASIAWQMA
ncbi:hypothetical protein QCD79_33930, partial [Pseudomonas quasicaspiana]|nr:hypothetical protein [Pseudomonas quasicaspiana]